MQSNLYGNRGLKPRDEKIIELVSQGLKNGEIAREIGTTEHVGKNYLRAIYDKLGMWNRLELALWQVSRSAAPRLEPAQSALATRDTLNRVGPFRSYLKIPLTKPSILLKKPEGDGLV